MRNGDEGAMGISIGPHNEAVGKVADEFYAISATKTIATNARRSTIVASRMIEVWPDFRW